jgi:hypothetical protein
MWASLVVKVVHIPKFAYIIITKELESWNTEGDKILHLLDSSSLNSHVGVVFKVGLVCHNIKLLEVQGCMHKVLLVVLVTYLALLG